LNIPSSRNLRLNNQYYFLNLNGNGHDCNEERNFLAENVSLICSR
jgi:hypothetical protein